MNSQSFDKLQEFARRELEYLNNNPNSVVITQGPNGSISVGRYHVVANRGRWQAIVDTVHEKIFSKKSHAVAFAVLWHKNRMTTANDLERNDLLLERLQEETDLLQQRMKSSMRSKDLDKFEIYRDKYLNAIAKKRHVADQLQKTLNSTKYIKLG
jgi:hypothetical protein